MIDENAADKKVKRLEIRDKGQNETCLREHRSEWLLTNNSYIIGFYGKDNENFGYGSFAENNVPDFVKVHFKD
ncbi:hypothetical protein SPSYN_00474 [Sporotomaculum syntrophicum]|uniref:Uncharacterized protein n=2 Tax=Sporotomaculum syntrophicum TaxID=182264 RepID=A0A9D3AXI4_9FIRM|nr:hypothetical protein SPSYN_00474 [Sporotomaculum syntrophicum]